MAEQRRFWLAGWLRSITNRLKTSNNVKKRYLIEKKRYRYDLRWHGKLMYCVGFAFSLPGESLPGKRHQINLAPVNLVLIPSIESLLISD